MKRTFLIAILSIVALAIPQLSIAGEQRSFNNGHYRDGYAEQSRYEQPWHQSYRDQYDDRNFDRRGYDYDHRGYDYDRRDYRDRHVGRSVAIIGGSAAGGALIGAAVGQGKGAAVGAVVGGVAGLIGDQIARHHNHR